SARQHSRMRESAFGYAGNFFNSYTVCGRIRNPEGGFPTACAFRHAAAPVCPLQHGCSALPDVRAAGQISPFRIRTKIPHPTDITKTGAPPHAAAPVVPNPARNPERLFLCSRCPIRLHRSIVTDERYLIHVLRGRYGGLRELGNGRRAFLREDRAQSQYRYVVVVPADGDTEHGIFAVPRAPVELARRAPRAGSHERVGNFSIRNGVRRVGRVFLYQRTVPYRGLLVGAAR